jgi:hypothetical protein
MNQTLTEHIKPDTQINQIMNKLSMNIVESRDTRFMCSVLDSVDEFSSSMNSKIRI